MIKPNRRYILIVVILAVIISVGILGYKYWEYRCYKISVSGGRYGSGGIGLADPSSVFCTCMGGKLESEKIPGKGEKGLCKIGSKTYDAWEYFCKKNKNSDSCKNYQTPEKTPTDETAEWQIYRNEKYGFEFKYPKSWEHFTEQEGDPYYEGDYFFAAVSDSINERILAFW